MTPNSPSAFVLVGPTASGKSAAAQFLAEQTGAPLVSADSMNIYRGMDIGTAKPSPAELRNIPTFGIDLADPTETFSVGDWLNAIKPAFFQTLEKPAIVAGGTGLYEDWGQSLNSDFSQNIRIQGLTPEPVVAGGTGLYVKCLLQGLDDLPAADEQLRARAEKMTLAELQSEAKAVAPAAYEALADKQNPRRLVRVLEMNASPDAVSSNGWKNEMPTVVGLHVERDVLHKRIAARVEKMYAAGLIEETRGLIGLKLSATAEKAIGYAEAFAVLRGEMSEAEAKEKTIVRTRQLAKRQMTWFRHQLNVEWIDTADFPTIGKLAEKISNVWKPVPVCL
jgi:tRNA dimethylallyltransferase